MSAQSISGINHCRLGTRDSVLAVTQTNMVQRALAHHWPQLKISQHPCKTLGDQQLEKRFEDIGTTGLFVKELEIGLLDNEYDIAVHSLKDMPSQVGEGLTLVPVFTRANPCDVLISSSGKTLSDLPQGSIIGTASARRQAQIQRLRPDCICKPIRGNVQTRLRKLNEGDYDAIILAAAGLERLGELDILANQQFDPILECIPSPNQGILAVEYASHRHDIAELITPLKVENTTVIAQAERAVIKATGSGCHTPLGAYATINDEQLSITAILFNQSDSTRWVEHQATGAIKDAEKLGTAVGHYLIKHCQ